MKKKYHFFNNKYKKGQIKKNWAKIVFLLFLF